MRSVGTAAADKAQLACHAISQAVRVARNSACPSAVWLSRVMPDLLHAPATARARPFVFFNVGANKGFAVSSMLQRFGSAHFTGVDWLRAFQTYRRAMNISQGGSEELCGACCACIERPPCATENASMKLQIHAFELLEENVQWLRVALNRFGVHGVHLVHAAVSNQSGSTFAQRARPGTESVSVQSSRPPALHPAQDASSVAPRKIDRIKLSDYVNKHGINHVDFMSIDTEGSDALVLEGARALLIAARVSVLEFEYHHVSFWGSSHPERRLLSSTIAWLDNISYSCFWQGRSGCAVPVSGKCWSSDFEIQRWSNLVCAHRRHDAFRTLREIANSCKQSPTTFSEPVDAAALNALHGTTYVNHRCRA